MFVSTVSMQCAAGAHLLSDGNTLCLWLRCANRFQLLLMGIQIISVTSEVFTLALACFLTSVCSSWISHNAAVCVRAAVTVLFGVIGTSRASERLHYITAGQSSDRRDARTAVYGLITLRLNLLHELIIYDWCHSHLIFASLWLAAVQALICIKMSISQHSHDRDECF